MPLIGYDYDEDGNLAGVVNSSGEPLRFRYDEAGRLTGWRDRNGYCYGYGYDGQGRCVRGEGPGGMLTGTFRYEPDAQVTTWTDVCGRGHHVRLSDAARVAAITDPLGHVTNWEHDERGRVTACTDPLGAGHPVWLSTPAATSPPSPAPTAARRVPSTTSAACRCASPIPPGASGSRSTTSAATAPWSPRPDGAATRFGYDDRRAPGQRHRSERRGDPDHAATAPACRSR